MNQKLLKLKTLNEILGGARLILTGSGALHFHGLVNEDDVKDLDIIAVGLTELQCEILQNLQKAKPNPKFFKGSSLAFSFFYDGLKVDIWKVDSFNEGVELFTKDGIQVANVTGIVKAKLSYNRPKDWIQLLKMSRLIYNEKSFDSAIASIKTDVDHYGMEV